MDVVILRNCNNFCTRLTNNSFNTKLHFNMIFNRRVFPAGWLANESLCLNCYEKTAETADLLITFFSQKLLRIYLK